MNRLWKELLSVVIIALICVWFGESVWDVAKELAILYLVIGVVSVLLVCYIGWALTRAMNPPRNQNNEPDSPVS